MNHEISYSIPPSLPGDPQTTVNVTWDVEIQADARGSRDRSIWIESRFLYAEVKIGGLDFEASGAMEGTAFGEWIEARRQDITFEAIGTTEDDAKRQYSEDEDQADYESSQIGRPI